MKPKYIIERVGDIWFIFGNFGKSEDGSRVAIADHNGDVFRHVPVDIANKAIAARDAFLAQLAELLKGELLKGELLKGDDEYY